MRGKLLNKKVGTFEKVGTKWGKNYYIKSRYMLNLYSKKCIDIWQKNVKLSEGKSEVHT